MELRHSTRAREMMTVLSTQDVDVSRGTSMQFETCAAKSVAPQPPGSLHSIPAAALASDHRKSSDEELLEAAKHGNEEAFVELCERSAHSLRGRLFRMLGNREDAEDVLQDSLFKAYTHLAEFRGSCKFSSWLTRIAINSALMQLRKKRSRPVMSFPQRGDDDQRSEDSDFADPSPSAENVCARREANELLKCVVQELPTSYRKIVTEFHERERSLQEAADAVGITITAAKSRLLRARLAMRATLKTKRFSMADAAF